MAAPLWTPSVERQRETQLWRFAEGCGFDDVSTFIQSGNVLFRSGSGAKQVGAQLHDAILETAGIDTRIAMRTAAQLRRCLPPTRSSIAPTTRRSCR